jgi:hypothetical protein
MTYASRYLILLPIVVSAVMANAAPVTWTFQNVTFGNNSTATLTGSFTFDADTNTYSNINITIVAGAMGAGVQAGTYQFLDPSAISDSSTLVATVNSNFLDGEPVLFFHFTTPLTDVGGTVSLDTATSETATCSGALCPSLKAGPTVSITGGLVSAPVSISVNDGPYQIGFAANLNIGDSVVNLSNDGINGGVFGAIPPTRGNICANVYVFDPQEEEIGCCACLVTPNGLNSLSVKSDLISNNLTPAVPTSVVIKLVGSTPGIDTTGAYTVCNPAKLGFAVGEAGEIYPLATTRGMLAWGTTLAQNSTPGTFNAVPVPFLNGSLSVPTDMIEGLLNVADPGTELAGLTSLCNFIQANGTGFGICKSCRLGALGGAKQ